MKQWVEDRENPEGKIAREKRMSDAAKNRKKPMKKIVPIEALANLYGVELSRILK